MKYTIDSRTVEPGDIFIPVKGEHHDGRDFIPDVLAKGGRVLDVDLTKFSAQYRKKLKCHVIGITGSAGKTSVKDQLFAILSQKFKVVRTLENQNNEIGVPLTLLSADHTTEILLVEMAMRHRGDMRHLAKIVRPSHTVITNIGLSHIELLKTQRNIALAKSEIYLPPASWQTSDRYTWINYDSAFAELLAQKAHTAGYKVLPFGGQSLPEQNVNVCFAVGRQFGMTNEEIQAGFKQYQPSKHRLIQSSLAQNMILLDDAYNANPDGVKYALQYCRQFSQRRILILGDMLELGKFSEQAHRDIAGAAVDAGFSIVFTFGPNSRALETDLLTVMHFEDRDALHAAVKSELKSGDLVLVKGSRGMKMEDTVAFLKATYPL